MYLNIVQSCLFFLSFPGEGVVSEPSDQVEEAAAAARKVFPLQHEPAGMPSRLE